MDDEIERSVQKGQRVILQRLEEEVRIFQVLFANLKIEAPEPVQKAPS